MQRVHIILHMLVGRSVCPSLTFLFLINYSRTLCPIFIKLCPHICPGQQRNPIDFEVTGSKVKVIRVKCAKTVKVPISKMNFFIHLCNLFTNPIVQNICDQKNNFRGHNVVNNSCSPLCSKSRNNSCHRHQDCSS